jgi:hypothetical protein
MCNKMLLTLVLIASTLLAGSATQTDWTGGPGAPGPMSSWTDTFSTSYLVDWHRTPGSIKLDENAESHSVMSTTSSSILWSKPCELSNDDYPDVFVRLGGKALCYLYTNGGSSAPGTFSLTDGWACAWDDMDSGDVNGDGLQDFIAVGDPNVWLERLSGGGWQSHALTPSLLNRDFVYLIDLDQDGDLDYIGDDGTGGIGHLRWFENLGGEDNWEMHTIQQGGIESISSLDVSDYDNDGDYDIVCGTQSDEFYLFVNQGLADGWTLQVIQYSTEGEFQRVTFSDLDGIDPQELLTVATYSTGEVIYFQETAPGVWSAHLITSYPYRVRYAASGDIDGDGDQDVGVSSTVDDSNPYYLMWYENRYGDASEWLFHPVISEHVWPYRLSAADFNGDGRDDLIGYYSPYESSTDYILWWNMMPDSYHSGQCLLESSILQVSGGASWSALDWNATLPSQTTVKFQVRSSDDPSDMGAWSSNIFSPGSITVWTTPGDAYFQYKAILETLDPTATPSLNSVTVSWNQVGIEGGEEPSALSMEPLRNPAVGFVELRLSLPSLMQVRLDVFDVSGRLVARVLDGELEQGSHTIQVSDLAPGLYFARLVAGTETLLERLTVIGL